MSGYAHQAEREHSNQSLSSGRGSGKHSLLLQLLFSLVLTLVGNLICLRREAMVHGFSEIG